MEYSIIIFGSYTRDDFDNLSDKDILFVYDKLYPVDKIIYAQRNGWNCAEYTVDEFKHIAEIGSLFVQHIKQDGIIIKDNNKMIKNILFEYHPKNNYDQEIFDTVKSFNIVKNIENSVIGILWAIDVISVLFRNYCILFLANNKIYEFSFKKINYVIKDIFCLNDEEYNCICKLREFKYIYRHKCRTDFFYIKEYITEIINILCKKININIDANFLSKDNFIDRQYKSLLDERDSGYRRLRIFESIYNAMPQIHHCELAKKYEEIIINPSKYAYTFQCHDFLKEFMGIAI